MNIKNRITLFSTVWMLIILLITNGSIYFLFQKNMTDNALERMETQMDNIIEGINFSKANVDIKQLLNAYLPANSMIRIISKEDQKIHSYTKDEKLEKLDIKYRENQHTEVKQSNGTIYTVAQHPIIWTNGEVVSLVLTEEQSSIQNTMRILRVVLIAATLVILIPSFIGGRILSNLIVNPIGSMIKTMEEIQNRGTFKRISIESKTNDELNKLATTFNHMIELLETNYKKQEQFVSDASHELKTPLTVIESYAQMLKRWGNKKPEVLEEAVEAIHSESLRMKDLTKQMLLLAKDETQLDLQYEQVDLISLSKDAAKNLQNAYQRKIMVQSDQQELTIMGDPLKLKQILFILLDNAIKYSEKEIKISLSASSNSATISVTDYGIGIPKEDLDKVYDRFFRVDKARSRETGGSGLGLSIAKRIIHAHHGQMEIVSKEGVGTTVTIDLPRSLQD
ncbi:sensor histidine kinase [Metabacillus arenae]|uniref:histidine kinase n=1 Tax=Metabacillus arenae TaxID=2771434 RepID=A0A926RZ15_9BACI|nr:HAMP domain-containing sensor histidine kinase [Metabacillus arenae]MBD1383553.1 HAMP domain-containing histidine kinase [Metabacillus arenae]